RTDEKANQGKGVQCHECEGYDHIRIECAIYLKKQKKSQAVSWSDEDDSEGEVENESELCIRSEEVCKTLEKQKKIIAHLQAERNDHLSTISELNNEELVHMSKQVRMLNNDTDMLENIIEVGQQSGKPKGVG
ncbi:gag-protease polyprotein, partial [Trifolium medium]|nr:gag-protease polyprotein [Trifolium medium]